MGFNLGQDLNTALGNADSAISSVSGSIGAIKNAASAVGNFVSTGDVASLARSINLPAAGEAVGDILSAVSLFTDDNNPNDWRVRLGIARWSSFQSSPVLKPLRDAGGLVFPYTPSVSTNSTTNYSAIKVSQTNYPMYYYASSDPGQIIINCDWYVEDVTQGLYWVAAIHYIRSLHKMFAGADPKAGNPPPIVNFNAYGQYVFNNVPVVVVSSSITFPPEVDYISVPVVGSAAGEVQGIADSLGGLAGTTSSLFQGTGLGSVANTVGNIAGGVGQVAGLLGTFGVGGATNVGTAHVPTKSTISVTLQTMYSRQSVRNFSLDRFVTGGYATQRFGYL